MVMVFLSIATGKTVQMYRLTLHFAIVSFRKAKYVDRGKTGEPQVSVPGF